MDRLKFISLRGGVITLVIVSVIPALVLILHSGFDQRRSARLAAQNEALQVAQLAARSHDNLIEQTQQLLTVLAQLPQLQRNNPRECSRLLKQILDQNQRYTNFAVINADGNVLCSALPFKSNLNVADRSFFQQVLAKKRFLIGEIIIGRITGKPSLPLVYPMLDEHQDIRAILYSAVDLAWLSALASAADLPPGSTLTVIDSDGTVLVHFPYGTKWVGRSLPDGSLLEALESQREGLMEASDMDHVDRIYAVASLDTEIGDGALRLSVGIPKEVVFAKADTTLALNVLALAFVAAFALVAAWIGGDVFVLNKINRLLNAVRQVTKGNLGARTSLAAHGNELDELGCAFDEMASAIQKHTAENNAAKHHIARLNRVYAVLSGINSSIMRIRERDALFAEACRIAIDLGQFRLAWIGLIDTACGEFKSVCHAGHEAGYLDMIRIVCDAGSTRLDTVGGRLGAGRAVICTDIASETRAEFARDAALERGYRSCIMLPLHLTGKVIGTLNLYAAEPGFFDSDELRLLGELAADTSLGLEYIEKEEELHELSYYDALTGIPNRVLFADRLDQALSRGPYHARPVALLMLDIVRFKELNTAHGHHIGDRLLKEIASYLSDIVRTGDTVARTGSAAFGMILTDLAHAADAAIIAQQIADRFREPLHIDDKEIFVTIHIGIAVAPDDGQDAETIVRNADAALNRLERHAGSGYRFYTPEIYAHTLQKLDIEQELRHAIERNELHLHYQPIVDFASLKIVGCEALLRWNNAKLGSVAPAEFIPIAEGSELIVSIGEWVLKTASRQAMHWNQQGWQTNVAINISVIQLRQPDFADRINIILNESHFNARQFPLVLELTETVLMENAEYSVEILRQLRDQGLLVYIDDFGTGYSSLSYLRALPVDTLKIDMAFVRDIASNSNDALIVKTIIALADSLGKNVIAEGVETLEQMRILHNLGCTKAQGFLFSPAIPADDLFEMARKPFSLPAA